MEGALSGISPSHMSEPIHILAGHPLVGTWSDPEGWSLVELTVRARPAGFDVLAAELRGRPEPLEVSDVSWDGVTLRCVTVVPSNGDREEHELSFAAEGLVHHRLTLQDFLMLKPVASAPPTEERDGEPISILTGHPLVGTWSDPRGHSSVEYTVQARAGGFDVFAVDRTDSEVFEVSGVTWDGEHLSFVTVVPSNGHRVEHEFSAAGPGVVQLRFTLTQTLKRREP